MHTEFSVYSLNTYSCAVCYILNTNIQLRYMFHGPSFVQSPHAPASPPPHSLLADPPPPPTDSPPQHNLFTQRCFPSIMRARQGPCSPPPHSSPIPKFSAVSHRLRSPNTKSSNFLYSPSQPHRGDQAGSAHTVKAPAFPIPSGWKGLVYSLRW